VLFDSKAQAQNGCRWTTPALKEAAIEVFFQDWRGFMLSHSGFHFTHWL